MRRKYNNDSWREEICKLPPTYLPIAFCWKQGIYFCLHDSKQWNLKIRSTIFLPLIILANSPELCFSLSSSHSPPSLSMCVCVHISLHLEITSILRFHNNFALQCCVMVVSEPRTAPEPYHSHTFYTYGSGMIRFLLQSQVKSSLIHHSKKIILRVK